MKTQSVRLSFAYLTSTHVTSNQIKSYQVTSLHVMSSHVMSIHTFLLFRIDSLPRIASRLISKYTSVFVVARSFRSSSVLCTWSFHNYVVSQLFRFETLSLPVNSTFQMGPPGPSVRPSDGRSVTCFFQMPKMDNFLYELHRKREILDGYQIQVF